MLCVVDAPVQLVALPAVVDTDLLLYARSLRATRDFGLRAYTECAPATGALGVQKVR